MRVGYGQLGRSINFREEKWSAVGADNETPLYLHHLANKYPDIEWVIVTRNSGECPQDVGYPPNVTNPWTASWDGIKQELKALMPDKVAAMKVYAERVVPWFEELDGLVLWAGQHGTSNFPIPKVGERDVVTSPQDSFFYYCAPILMGINAFRDRDPLKYEEIWLLPDSRNYLKARDLKWPLRHPVLCQYDFSRTEKNERYEDPRTPVECGFDPMSTVVDDHSVWLAMQRYEYSRLEISGILPEAIGDVFSDHWDRPGHFGLFINEARSYVKENRFDIVRDWVLPLDPWFLHGTWPKESQQRLGREITTAPRADYYPMLKSVRCTFTTPSSGSGYATTKPWEAFAAGTVCLFHPKYDDQGWIIPTKPTTGSDRLNFLSQMLRVDSPAQLRERVEMFNHDQKLWHDVVTVQKQYYDWAVETDLITQLIAARLGVTG